MEQSNKVEHYQNGAIVRDSDAVSYVINKPTNQYVKLSDVLECKLTKPVVVRSPYVPGQTTLTYTGKPYVELVSTRLSDNQYYSRSSRGNNAYELQNSSSDRFAVVLADEATSTINLAGLFSDPVKIFPPAIRRVLADYGIGLKGKLAEAAQKYNGGVNASDVAAQNDANKFRGLLNQLDAGVLCNLEVALSPGNMANLALGNLGQTLAPLVVSNNKGRSRERDSDLTHGDIFLGSHRR